MRALTRKFGSDLAVMAASIFPLELFNAQQVLTAVGNKARNFWKSLVLDHNGAGAGPLIFRDSVNDVNRIAIARINVRDDRQPRASGDRPQHVEMLCH